MTGRVLGDTETTRVMLAGYATRYEFPVVPQDHPLRAVYRDYDCEVILLERGWRTPDEWVVRDASFMRMGPYSTAELGLALDACLEAAAERLDELEANHRAITTVEAQRAQAAANLERRTL